MRPKRYFTQWAAQFYVAAELTRRGYLVSLTLGMAPKADLLVVSPSGKHFMVDVKGLSSPNWWIIGEHGLELHEDLYFILVYIPKDPEQSPRFFAMTSYDVKTEIEKHLDELRAREREITNLEYGFYWKVAFKYENRWDKLPT